jgi:hypothetical protein
LTALCEWVDEDPRVAGEMIGALADELRLLHDILDRSLITMDEELRLCRAHLQIMSRRRCGSPRVADRQGLSRVAESSNDCGACVATSGDRSGDSRARQAGDPPRCSSDRTGR